MISHQVSRLFFIALLFLMSSLIWADQSRLLIDNIEINESGQVTVVSNIVMSDQQAEMLKNGIPFTFKYEIALQERKRLGIWQTSYRRELPLELKYHALSKQYVIADERLSTLKSYPTLTLALTHIGYLRNLSLLTKKELELLADDYQFQGKARLRLDIEALPAPLRIPAYLSKKWRLNSGWKLFSWSDQG